jgi:hypothetical protein
MKPIGNTQPTNKDKQAQYNKCHPCHRNWPHWADVRRPAHMVGQADHKGAHARGQQYKQPQKEQFRAIVGEVALDSPKALNVLSVCGWVSEH